jgi:excisionase family DNA binding protein
MLMLLRVPTGKKAEMTTTKTRAPRTKRVADAQSATLTPIQSTLITNFGTSATYRMLRAGEMPAIRVGQRLFIPRTALMAWLASCGGAGK